MAASPISLLRELESLKMVFGGQAAGRKRAILERLYRARFKRASHVERFHEALCFMHAYPDDAWVHAAVLVHLVAFGARSDLRRHARQLENTGIAGTPIVFRFFWPTARWLARRWPRHLHLDWQAVKSRERLEALLPMLAHPGEAPGLDEYAFSLREWIERLKGPDETGAAFLVRRFAALAMDESLREVIYDEIEPQMRLSPGPGVPSRTLARRAIPSAHYQRVPLARARPDLAREIRRPPLAVRAVSRREGRELIDMARAAMVTRSRDLDVFAYGDPNDVRLVDCGAGLQFACIGAVPERRLMLEAVYGFLTLKNQVPIGYVLTSAIYGSSEIAYNVFDTYRGAEAGTIYGRVVSMTHHLFGSDTFTIYPYQLGDGNDEAIQSGAWWFYYKLGFRPRDPAVVQVMREELRRMKSDPSHRTDAATLRRLAVANVYYSTGRERDDVMGLLSLPNVGLHVTRYLSERFGSDRDRGRAVCAREAAKLLGVRSLAGFSRGERHAWERWAPLALSLPGVSRWSSAEKRALAQVMRAKGGRRESDFVRRFDTHRRLRRALLQAARAAEP